MKKALILILPLLLSCHGSRPKKIGVLNWSGTIIGCQMAYRGILDGLISGGYKDGLNIKIDNRDAGGSAEAALKIAQEFAEKNYDLIITIGSEAVLTALKATSKIPIVFACASDAKAIGAVEDWNSPGKNATGVSYLAPPKDFMDAVTQLIPNAKRLGIIFVEGATTGAATAKDMADAAKARGLIPSLRPITKSELKDLKAAVKKRLHNIDLLYVAVDPFFYEPENIKLILKTAANVPTMIISDNYVKSGALLSLNGDFYETGRQAVSHILKIFSGIRPQEIPAERPYVIRFSLNKGVADKLGIKVSRATLIKADSIVE